MRKDNIGFLTIAQNSNDINYLNLAYLQAMNAKLLHPKFKYAVVVDKTTNDLITDRMRKVFDYVILLPLDYADTHNKKFANEVQVFRLSPFKETIKLESDLLFTRSIDHWLYAARLKHILLSYNCKNYRQNTIDLMVYRKLFVNNNLPNIYNGLMYFRHSAEASQFFITAEIIMNNWDEIKDILINCHEEIPSTDVLFAITALVYGVEHCTIPSLDFFNFVHLKPGINGWGISDTSWRSLVSNELDNNMIRVHNLNQYHPVHYHDKSFANQEIIKFYEQLYERILE